MTLVRMFRNGSIVAVADYLDRGDAQFALNVLSRAMPDCTFKINDSREIIHGCTSEERVEAPKVIKERTNKGAK